MKMCRKFDTEWGCVDGAAVFAMLSADDRRVLESVSVEAANRALGREYVSARWRRVKDSMVRAMAAATELSRYDPPGVQA